MSAFERVRLQVQQGVTARLRTSPIPRVVSAGVCPTPRSASMMWAWRRKEWTSSPFACTWSLGRRRMFPAKLLRLPVLPATSTWRSMQERMLSIYVCACTLSMCSASTRCFLALGLIGSRQVCEEHSASPKVSVPVLTSVRCCCLCVARTIMVSTPKRHFAVLSSNSLVVRKLSWAGSGEFPTCIWKNSELVAIMREVLLSEDAYVCAAAYSGIFLFRSHFGECW